VLPVNASPSSTAEPVLEVASRNATERAILDAGRQALAEQPYAKLTMEGIARRAFVSRTAVYFYFDSKRDLVDRLIQRAFADMHTAAEPYLAGAGDPRRELRQALRQVMAVVDDNAHVLMLAARLTGRGDEQHLPAQWAPYITRFVQSTTQRIARDQEAGIAPADIPAQRSAQALLAMVESHVTREVVIRGADAGESVRVLAELWWRAVYARPEDIAGA
jgi:AcrR family transcriptional regulator